MTPNQLTRHYGNGNRAARALGISRQAVRRWIAQGYVPETRQYQIEVLTGGKLRADRRVNGR